MWIVQSNNEITRFLFGIAYREWRRVKSKLKHQQKVKHETLYQVSNFDATGFTSLLRERKKEKLSMRRWILDVLII